jgi:hypothetical protein
LRGFRPATRERVIGINAPPSALLVLDARRNNAHALSAQVFVCLLDASEQHIRMASATVSTPVRMGLSPLFGFSVLRTTLALIEEIGVRTLEGIARCHRDADVVIDHQFSQG